MLSDLASEYSDALATDNPFVTNEVPKITLLESSFEELEEQLVDTYVGTVASGLKIMVRKAIEDEKVNPPKPIELIGISDCPIEWIHYLMEVQVRIDICFLYTIQSQHVISSMMMHTSFSSFLLGIRRGKGYLSCVAFVKRNFFCFNMLSNSVFAYSPGRSL